MVEGLTYIESLARSRPDNGRRYQRLFPLFNVRNPSRGGAVAARRAHNPKVEGSNPSPATNADPRAPRTTRARGSQLNMLWWSERGGPTRSHPEHGSETPQRRRYWGSNPLWKIGHCQGVDMDAPRDTRGASSIFGRARSARLRRAHERHGVRNRRLARDRREVAQERVHVQVVRARVRRLPVEELRVRLVRARAET